MPLEEFVTKARLLVDDSGYPAAVKQETLRDALVFGLKSDKVRRDAIAKGNELTFQQVYEFAKVDESTRVQMKAITQHEGSSELHAVRSRKKPTFFKKPQQEPEQKKLRFQRVTRSHSRNHSSLNQRDASDVGGNHDRSAECPAKFAKCKFCGKQGHFLKVCLKSDHQRVHQIGTSDKTSDSTDATDTSVFLGTLPSEKSLVSETQPLSVHSVSRYAKRIYAFITLNDQHKMKLKVDTGADICAVNIDSRLLFSYRHQEG